jgi:hypothetical protein
MSYDSIGRVLSSSTLITSSTFAYNSSNLQIDVETVSYTLPGQPAFTRVIDRSQDTLSRETGWQLKDTTTVENVFDLPDK